MNAPEQNTIALVFDYDQTLSPHYMQDDVIFPEFGIDPVAFWAHCAELVRHSGYDNELAYLKSLLDALAPDRPSNEQLRALGARMRLYPGLPDMFDELTDTLLAPEHRARGIRCEYYVITAGLKVLIEGSPLGPHLRAAFGCEFAEDDTGRICFPSRVVGHTQKTQFLFRINKGILDLTLDVDEPMPDAMRPVPFPHMIYIGDGPTDIPCFTVVRHAGGHAIAVYNPGDPTRASFRKCYQLAERVRHIAPSDYRPGSHLRLLLEEMVAEIAENIARTPHTPPAPAPKPRPGAGRRAPGALPGRTKNP